MGYELLCTAVAERTDLFVQTMDSCLANLDQMPTRIIVHEDVRPGKGEPGGIYAWLEQNKAKTSIDFLHKVRSPAGGLGPAMRWCFEQAKTPIVFYTQEDWLFVRPVPVARCLEIMDRHGLNHVRFNKRKTMRAKHEDTPNPWFKVEVTFDDISGVPQKMCISDHFYTQASLWRVSSVLAGICDNADKNAQANAFVAAFNNWMNTKHIGNLSKAMDQATRHANLKTYIWGPVAEPAFIKHLGSVRTTGPIVHTAEIKGQR